MRYLINLNRIHNAHKQEELFHLNMEYMSVEMSFLNNNCLVKIWDMKYLTLGHSVKMTNRALELGLPWFVEKFDYR